MAGEKLLDAQCSRCEATCSFNFCEGCSIVQYCCDDHQIEDWKRHESPCFAIREARTAMEKEAHELRNAPDGDQFQDCIGHFGDLDETGPYMTWKLAYIEALRKIKTRKALQVALDQANESLHLDRYNPHAARNFTPLLMLRLGRDQEAYDFLKWQFTTDGYHSYSWRNDLTLPYLHLKNENALESTQDMKIDGHGPVPMISLILIKVRILFDLLELDKRNMDLIRNRLPQEIIDIIAMQIASEVVANNEDVMSDVRKGKSLITYIDDLQIQLDELYEAIDSRTWEAIIGPQPVDPTFRGNFRGKQLASKAALKHTVDALYEAWEETPGAMEWVKGKLDEQKQAQDQADTERA